MLLVDRRPLVCGVGGGGQEGGNLGLDLRLLLHEKLESFVAVKRSLDPEVRHLGMLSFDVLREVAVFAPISRGSFSCNVCSLVSAGLVPRQQEHSKLKANRIYNIRMNDRWR
jgi:hypothetical protein